MDVYKAVSSTEDTSCLTMVAQDNNKTSTVGTENQSPSNTTIQNEDGEYTIINSIIEWIFRFYHKIIFLRKKFFFRKKSRNLLWS